jgi:hypothetical protein
MDSKILARPACYDSSTNASVQALENLPRGATGDGAVLEGEEGLREGDLGRLQGLWETLREVGEAARKEGSVSRPLSYSQKMGGAERVVSTGSRWLWMRNIVGTNPPLMGTPCSCPRNSTRFLNTSKAF